MMFSFLSTIAQDESRSISENVKWAYRERFKRGEYNLGNNRILGYDSVDGKLVPNKEADAVRAIYAFFLEGRSIEEIRRLMADYGVRTRKGSLISHNDILYILKNETYRGDKLLQKQPPKDFLTKKPDKKVHYESFYLEGDHEAIVEPAVWDAVQEKLKQKMEIENAVGHRGGQPHFLYGLLFCGECGEPMTRRTLRAYDGEKYKAWTCRERHKGRKGNGCKCRTIRETDLIASICVQMGYERFDEERFLDEVRRVEINEDGMEITRQRIPVTA